MSPHSSQRRFVAAFDAARAAAAHQHPGCGCCAWGRFLRPGRRRAGFGRKPFIGLVSLAGMVALMLVTFRALRPLLLGMMAIGVGMVTALSALPAAVRDAGCRRQSSAPPDRHRLDYALLYFGQVFSPRGERKRASPMSLRHHPGRRDHRNRLCHPVAVTVPRLASGGGVLGGRAGWSFLTVVLRFRCSPHSPRRPRQAAREAGVGAVGVLGRIALAPAGGGAGIAGLSPVARRLTVDAHVRHQQALSPAGWWSRPTSSASPVSARPRNSSSSRLLTRSRRSKREEALALPVSPSQAAHRLCVW